MTQAVLTTQVTELSTESGLHKEERQIIARELNFAVADTYKLLIETQGVHWNVQGPLFYSVHKLTEEQYREMFEAVDELAERGRALGFPAPQNFAVIDHLSSINEAEEGCDLQQQLEHLVACNEMIASEMRQMVRRAEEINDVKTADLLTERIGVHEENAWMLRATIAS